MDHDRTDQKWFESWTIHGPTNHGETPLNVNFSVRRCECDSVGACDWRGDRGHCQEDFSFPGLEQIESSSLLSSQKCRDLPQTEIGFWTCDAEQTCSLV